nr:hypothetical protein Iba_chr08bCG2120 [Ipomoea batatas]
MRVEAKIEFLINTEISIKKIAVIKNWRREETETAGMKEKGTEGNKKGQTKQKMTTNKTAYKISHNVFGFGLTMFCTFAYVSAGHS